MRISLVKSGGTGRSVTETDDVVETLSLALRVLACVRDRETGVLDVDAEGGVSGGGKVAHCEERLACTSAQGTWD